MSKISKTQLVALQKKYKTDALIGEQYGITRQAIHQLRKKYGIDSLAAKNAERNEGIVKSYNSGVAVATLAKKNKLSVSQTYRVIIDAKKGKKKAAKKKVAKRKK